MILGYPHLGNILDSHHGRAGHQGTAIKVALATQGMRKHKNPGEGREDDAPETRREKNMGIEMGFVKWGIPKTNEIEYFSLMTWIFRGYLQV